MIIMNSLKLRYTALAASMTIIPAVAAQQNDSPEDPSLTKEIKVEREVEPLIREAKRLNISPEISLSPFNKTDLTYSDRTITARIPSTFSLLEPAAYLDSVPRAPWRGYVAGGYFPIFNAALSAGYRIIDTERSNLDLWMQYDGYRYSVKADDKSYARYSNTLQIGSKLHTLIGSKSALDLSLNYLVDRFRYPAFINTDFIQLGEEPVHNMHQTVNNVEFAAGFTSKIKDFSYKLRLDYNHFGYAQSGVWPRFEIEDYPYNSQYLNPVRENHITIGGNLTTNDETASRGIVNLDLSVVSNSRRSITDYPFLTVDDPFKPDKNYNHALLTLTPGYIYTVNNFTLDLRARIDLTFNSGKFFHIAPDVNISWRPANILTIWAKLGGGEWQNTLLSLYEVSELSQPMMAYQNSHIPLTVNAGITAGPFKGGWIKLYGGYARANDWLMPAVTSPGILSFYALDIKGIHGGVAMGYNYRDFAEIELKFEGAPTGLRKGYYLWRDRAGQVFDLKISAKPLRPLTVSASWQLRANRSVCFPEYFDFSSSDNIHTTVETTITNRLNNLSLINIGGNWQFNNRFGVFVTLENILGRHTTDVDLLPGQGFHGLVGASYKF